MRLVECDLDVLLPASGDRSERCIGEEIARLASERKAASLCGEALPSFRIVLQCCEFQVQTLVALRAEVEVVVDDEEHEVPLQARRVFEPALPGHVSLSSSRCTTVTRILEYGHKISAGRVAGAP